ncbi:MAG: YbhB/YbcL family Raf kinase inhibitor-like protein [Myxococcales bacterium]|jgi:Raf kinase inhibitor-like YbhB/YbcL family protein|nr:YbhB/YbcL family Raf kinase inhibitor-like protein [Myxococcales bacterium]
MLNRPLSAVILGCLLPLFCLACSDEDAPDTLIVTSPAFGDGQVIPARHTCAGAGESPALFIANPPPGTQSFALRLEGPTTQSARETLWLIWGIPAGSGALPHGVQPQAYEVPPFQQGRADNDLVGYQPPCAPTRDYAEYRFTAFALDAADIPGLGHPADRATFDRSMQSHVLATGTLTGRSRRR